MGAGYQQYLRRRKEIKDRMGVCVCGHTVSQHWETGPNGDIKVYDCAESGCRCEKFEKKGS